MNTRDAKPKVEVLRRSPSSYELRQIARQRFLQSRRVEGSFQRQLVLAGRQVGSLIQSFAPRGFVEDMGMLQRALAEYAQSLAPWASSVASRMQHEVNQRDSRAWYELSDELGAGLRRMIASAPVGQAMRDLLSEQVHLITSLPTEAGQRVHRLTLEAMARGERAESVREEIMKSGSVTVSRAKLIARTEVARTASVLTETRAKYVGSETYIWRTAMDSDVRPALSMSPRARARFIGSHRKLEGKIFRWDSPPVSGQHGERAHPGQIYNCRCWPEPILPDVI